MENYKILVIEDNEAVQDNIKELLELAGYAVETASNGKDGVTLAQRVSPDLILCDIMMPVMDGYGVLYILSKNPETAAIPFVFLTAKADAHDVRRGMNEGADDYITKPFEEIELLQAVETRLKRTQLLNDRSSGSMESFNTIVGVAENLSKIKQLASDVRSVSFSKKDVIYEQDSNAHFVYLIESGQVKCSRVNQDGKELITQLLSAGDFFGYESVIREQKYDHSAIAMQATECTAIGAGEFIKLVSSHPEITTALVRLLTDRISEENAELISLAYNSVRKRVALALVKLSESASQPDNDWFAAARDDVAQIAGTATESVIRVMTELKEDGYIQIEGRKIRLQQAEKLKDLPY